MLIDPNYLTQKPFGNIYLLCVSCVSNKFDNTEIWFICYCMYRSTINTIITLKKP